MYNDITLEEILAKEIDLLKNNISNMEKELKEAKNVLGNLELLKEAKLTPGDNLSPVACFSILQKIEEDKKSRKKRLIADNIQ